MLRSYLPAIVFLMLGAPSAGRSRCSTRVIGPRRADAAQDDPYECGLPSEVKRGLRFGISFYLIAMLFILFDIEVVFLYPIAIELRAYGSFALGRDDRVHRAAVRRVRLRLAAGSARVAVSAPSRSAPPATRSREPLNAEQLLRGADLLGANQPAHLEGTELERHVERTRADDDARQGRRLGALELALPARPSAWPAARSR